MNKERTVDIDPIWQRFANTPNGHFEALVRLADNYEPDYMSIIGTFTPGVMKAKVPAGSLKRLQADEKVLGAEVREFIGSC